jgi:hypothetical protein
MAKQGFIQTALERYCDGAREEMVSFIPARLAVAGQVVDLRDSETDEYTRGWTVLPNGGEVVPFEVVNELSQQYKSQRVGSDIERGSRERMKRRRH